MNRPLKICHVITATDVGGAELMLLRLIAEQRNDVCIQQEVISLSGFGKVGEALVEMGIPVTSLNMTGVFSIPSALFGLFQHFRKETPDIVQTWMYHSDLLGGIAARLAGIRRIVWGVRTTDIGKASTKKTTLLVRELCAALSSRVPRKIVCAANASMKIHADLGYDINRMVVIPNGFEVARWHVEDGRRDMFRASLHIDNEDVVIGSVARFNPIKDHKTFIAAAGLLSAGFPFLRFLLVGRDVDASNAELMCAVEASGCQEKFILLGERDDMPACYGAMDIFCLHSRTEGFPNGLGEAMAMGLPCVSTNVGDAAFLMNDDRYIVESGDPKALATGLEALINLSPSERIALGKKARERIQKHFTMQSASQAFLDLYSRL